MSTDEGDEGYKLNIWLFVFCWDEGGLRVRL